MRLNGVSMSAVGAMMMMMGYGYVGRSLWWLGS